MDEQISARLSFMSDMLYAPQRVLTAIEQLSAADLDWLLPRVIALRLSRKGAALPHKETQLLAQITHSIPVEVQSRYQKLIALRESGSLTPDQLDELITLAPAYERLALIRLQLIAQLAELRQTTPSVLIQQLGLALPAHV